MRLNEIERPLPAVKQRATDIVTNLVKPGTVVYRGLRVGPEALKMSIRQILSSDFFNRNREFDHWSLDPEISKQFATGTHMNPDGTMGNKKDTINFLVAAKISPSDVDFQELRKLVIGIYPGINFETEKEIPVFRSSYPKLQLIRYWVLNKNTNQWVPGTKPERLK